MIFKYIQYLGECVYIKSAQLVYMKNNEEENVKGSDSEGEEEEDDVTTLTGSNNEVASSLRRSSHHSDGCSASTSRSEGPSRVLAAHMHK